jgi:hypothetical protein
MLASLVKIVIVIPFTQKIVLRTDHHTVVGVDDLIARISLQLKGDSSTQCYPDQSKVWLLSWITAKGDALRPMLPLQAPGPRA